MSDPCSLLVLFVDLNMCFDRNAKHMSARSLDIAEGGDLSSG